MKTTTLKAQLILIGSMLIGSQRMSAGVIDNVKKIVGDEMSSFNMTGLFIIAGVVGAGLLVYIISNHLIKEKDDENVVPHHHVNRHHHHRHHHTRPIVKKTA